MRFLRFIKLIIDEFVFNKVLECAWANLVKQIHVATDLSQVIDSHQNFLTNVFTRCLLDADSRQLLGQLRAVFNSITDYAQLYQNFNSIVMNEIDLRSQYEDDVSALFIIFCVL